MMSKKAFIIEYAPILILYNEMKDFVPYVWSNQYENIYIIIFLTYTVPSHITLPENFEGLPGYWSVMQAL